MILDIPQVCPPCYFGYSVGMRLPLSHFVEGVPFPMVSRGIILVLPGRSIESPLSAVPKGAGGDGILSPSILLFEMNSQVVGFTYRLREPDRVPGRHSSPPLYSGCSVKDYADSNFVAYLLLLRSGRSIESPLSAVPKGAGGDGILSPSILLFEMNSQVVGFTYRLREPDRVPGRHSSPPLYSGCSVKDYADSNFVAYLLLLRSDRSIESPLSAVPNGAGGDGILSPSILLFEMNSQVNIELSTPTVSIWSGGCETIYLYFLLYSALTIRILGHSALRSVKWRSSKKKRRLGFPFATGGWNVLMESKKGGKKGVQDYSIEEVHPHGGVNKFQSVAYSNGARKPS
ncbi:hypothetical protein IEQ34_007072 [Dendrobium chrysotoxum]|uniref:Uncharacterized protein n=1 Tax=Dendrobium chrysotoxum TaxID=161865 RepID=A0AAV7H6T6_DENCH|nr:hypothetical protein IEQ34_007072 [Dendrobium chrysotoxum]